MHGGVDEPNRTLKVSNMTYVHATTIIKSGRAHMERMEHLACSERWINASRPRKEGSAPGHGAELW